MRRNKLGRKAQDKDLLYAIVKVIYKSHGEVSLVEQDTIEYVSWTKYVFRFIIELLRKKNQVYFFPSFYGTF